MKHGENSEQGILGTDLHGGEHRVRLADEVGVGQHDALGIGGGARGVEQRRQVVFGGDEGLKASGAGGENGIEIADRGFADVSLQRDLRSDAAEVITKAMLSPATASVATGRCFTSQNSREAPLSISNVFTWSAWKAVSSGTAVRPAAMIPKYAATQRGWFAARIATRASRGTRVESQFATLSDMRVSSAKVTRSTVCCR